MAEDRKVVDIAADLVGPRAWRSIESIARKIGVPPSDVIAETFKRKIPVWFPVQNVIIGNHGAIPSLPTMNGIAQCTVAPKPDDARAIAFPLCSGWAAIHDQQPGAGDPLSTSEAPSALPFDKFGNVLLVLSEPGTAAAVAAKGFARVHRLSVFRPADGSRDLWDQGFVVPSWNAGEGWEPTEEESQLLVHRFTRSYSLDDLIDDRGRAWLCVTLRDLHVDSAGAQQLPKRWRRILGVSGHAADAAAPLGAVEAEPMQVGRPATRSIGTEGEGATRGRADSQAKAVTALRATVKAAWHNAAEIYAASTGGSIPALRPQPDVESLQTVAELLDELRACATNAVEIHAAGKRALAPGKKLPERLPHADEQQRSGGHCAAAARMAAAVMIGAKGFSFEVLRKAFRAAMQEN